MSKVDSYKTFKGGFQLQEFTDDVTDLLNFGKYASPVVTSVPAWNAGEGEFAFYNVVTPSTDRRIYVRLYSSWVVFSQILGSGSGPGGQPAGTEGQLQYNSGGAFQANTGMTYYQASGMLVLLGDSSGPFIPLQLSNTQSYASGITTSSVDLDFGFIGTDSQVGKIRVGKLGQYTTTATKDSFMSFHVEENDTLFETFRIYANGMVVGTVPALTQINPSSLPRYLFYDSGGGAANSRQIFAVLGAGNSAMTITNSGRVGIGAWLAELNLHIRDASAQVGLLIEGNGVQGIPALINLGAVDTVNTIAQIRVQGISQIGGAAKGQYALELVTSPRNEVSGVFYRNWTQIRNASPSRGFATSEDPEFAVGNVDPEISPISLTSAGQLISWETSQTIAIQRHSIFCAPIYDTIVAGNTSTVGSCATVYIQGAPIIGSSINALNRYALWIDEGNVRIDGDILTGAATTQTKAEGVFFTTSSLHVSSNSTTQNELIRAIVGTTSLVANTLSEGRTIRLSAMGYYNTPAAPGTIIFSVALSGVTILTTSSQTLVGNASTLGWQLESLITCQTTGGAGTVFAQGRIPIQSANTAWNCLQMINSSAITINTTGANPIHLYAQWGTAAAASQVYCTHAVGELLN